MVQCVRAAIILSGNTLENEEGEKRTKHTRYYFVCLCHRLCESKVNGELDVKTENPLMLDSEQQQTTSVEHNSTTERMCQKMRENCSLR